MKKIEINKIYNQNCIEGMNLIPKNKIDLVITDPPFAINFKAKRQIITELHHEYYLDIMKSSLRIIMISHLPG
jgi:DNA modification methylase